MIHFLALPELASLRLKRKNRTKFFPLIRKGEFRNLGYAAND